MTDPNSLLSTVVQSAAAFVAIVAGFIISRLLALSSERGGFQTRIRDIKLQINIKKENIEVLEKRLLTWDAEDFLEDSDVVDKIIESKGQISLADAMKLVTYLNRSEGELKPYWEDAIKVTKEAFHLIEENLTEFLEEIENFEVLLKNLGIDISSYRLKIYQQIFGIYLREYEKMQNPFGAMMSSIANIRMPDFRTANEANSYETLKRDIETLKRDKSALETQLSDLNTQLHQLGQPQGVTLGIIFLAYFSLVGIVIPVLLMPFATDQFTLNHKWAIFLLFFSGLIFFFVYLFKLVRQLAPDSTDTYLRASTKSWRLKLMKTQKSSRIRNIVLVSILLVLPLICGLLLIISTVQGRTSVNDVSFFLNIAAFVVTIYVAIFTGFLSWRALVFAALPRIDISYLGESTTAEKIFNTNESATLRFSITNIGWWYAKPASTNTKLYVNFDSSFDPKVVHYGSNLELVVDLIQRGKRNSKYFILRGIHLYYAEIGDNVDIDVQMPEHPGRYPVWITATSDQCDHGTFQFEVEVKEMVKTDALR